MNLKPQRLIDEVNVFADAGRLTSAVPSEMAVVA
jgi:hypothetical protein